MSSLMDIVGYSYRADIYCPKCILGRMTPQGQNRVSSLPVEEALEKLAEAAGIDRENESSYDSGDFPKVIFRDQARDDASQCATCGAILEIDFNGRFAVEGYDGVAFYLTDYVKFDPVDPDWEDPEIDYSQVRAIMVGDNREFIIPVEDLTPLRDEDYCGQCGQIGCTHDGMER